MTNYCICVIKLFSMSKMSPNWGVIPSNDRFLMRIERIFALVNTEIIWVNWKYAYVHYCYYYNCIWAREFTTPQSRLIYCSYIQYFQYFLDKYKILLLAWVYSEQITTEIPQTETWYDSKSGEPNRAWFAFKILHASLK